ncbi:hypothetical protein [Psychrobacter immobilis]|nr:hypothetical protein [Psychrobacter immobilis]
MSRVAPCHVHGMQFDGQLILATATSSDGLDGRPDRQQPWPVCGESVS